LDAPLSSNGHELAEAEAVAVLDVSLAVVSIIVFRRGKWKQKAL